MNPLRVAPVVGGGLIEQQLIHGGAQELSKGVIERDLAARQQLTTRMHSRSGLKRERETALRLTAHGRPNRRMFGEQERRLVEGRRAAALERDLDLADRRG